MLCHRLVSQRFLIATYLLFARSSSTSHASHKRIEGDSNSQKSRHLIPVNVFDAGTNAEPVVDDTSTPENDPSIVLNGATTAFDEYTLFRTYDISNGAAQAGTYNGLDNCGEGKNGSTQVRRRKVWRRGEGSKYYNAGCTSSHKTSRSKKSKKKKNKRKRGKGKGYYVPLGNVHKRTIYPSPTASPSAVETLEPTLVPTPPSTLGSDGPSLVPSFGSTQPSNSQP
jgi:hypothetical protein